MVTYITVERQQGAGRTTEQDITAIAGEAVQLGYAATPDAGVTTVVPSAVGAYIARNIDDTDGLSLTGTATATATGYAVTLNLTTAQSALLSGVYQYRQTETRSGEVSIPYAGRISFEAKSGG
jgi:hypothetical protein